MSNILDVPQNFSTTLNVGGGIDNSQTTGITLTTVTGLPTDGGILAFDWATPIDTTVIEYIEYGSLSGSDLAGVVRGQEGYSAKTHANGAKIVGVISRAHIKRLKDNFTAEHDRSTGAHKTTLVLTPTFSKALANFVSSGITIPTSGSLSTTSTSGVAFYTGVQYSVASDGGHAYTASKDTYVDVNPATGGFTYNAVSNGAAAPALTANSLRVAKVVTDGSTVASVTQDGVDSLGNIIYPFNPLAGTQRIRKPYVTDEHDYGTVSGAVTVDWSNGDRQRMTISGNVTLTYTNAKEGQVLSLDIDEDGTGGWTITLPTSKTPGGATITPTTSANALNSYIIKRDKQGNYRTQLAAGFA